MDKDVSTFKIGRIISLTALAAAARAVTGGPITPATAAPRKDPQVLTSRLSAAHEVRSSCLAAINGGLRNEAQNIDRRYSQINSALLHIFWFAVVLPYVYRLHP